MPTPGAMRLHALQQLRSGHWQVGEHITPSTGANEESRQLTRASAAMSGAPIATPISANLTYRVANHLFLEPKTPAIVHQQSFATMDLALPNFWPMAASSMSSRKPGREPQNRNSSARSSRSPKEAAPRSAPGKTVV